MQDLWHLGESLPGIQFLHCTLSDVKSPWETAGCKRVGRAELELGSVVQLFACGVACMPLACHEMDRFLPRCLDPCNKRAQAQGIGTVLSAGGKGQSWPCSRDNTVCVCRELIGRSKALWGKPGVLSSDP